MNGKFSFRELDLKGAYIIEPFYSVDERGPFIKDYNDEVFKQNGISHSIEETFYSASKKGVIRGLHMQLFKQQQKLVRCISGHIFDVIVDLRPDSPTFKKWEGFHLTEENMLSILVPPFFAHGFLAIEESVVCYKCNESFYKEGDSGIIFDEPELKIDWPYDLVGGKKKIMISDKDKNLYSLNEFLLKYEDGKSNE